MRSLGRTLVTTGVWAGLLFGAAAAYVAWQIQMVAGPAAPTPQTLSLAELIAKGPGKNLHVELTDVAFGPPTVETQGDRWECVWIPLRPAGQAKAPPAPAVLLRASRPRGQAQLDDLVKQSRLAVLVTNSLPQRSVWKARPSADLQRTYPKLDLAKVTFLAEPDLDFAGFVLTPDVVFDRTSAQIVWGVAIGLLSLGFFCLLLRWSQKSGAGKKAREACIRPEDEYTRGRLAVEIPQSEHRFKAWDCFCLARKYLLWAAVLFLVGLAPMSGVAFSLDRGSFLSAVVFALIGLLFFRWGWKVVKATVRLYSQGALHIAVCHGGLRWRSRSGDRAALWTEVVAGQVRQVATRQMGTGALVGYTGICTILLHSGETLYFTNDTITDFVRFASLAHSGHEETRQLSKRQFMNGARGQVFPAARPDPVRR